MSLLVDLWTDSLDPGYAAAARQPAAAPSARRSLPLAAGVLAVAFVVIVAAEQARVRAPAAARSRAALAAQVQQESRSVDTLAAQVNRLTADVARLRDASLGGTAAGTALRTRIRREELAAGTVAVSGPGLSVMLSDAPQRSGGQQNQNRVLDHDLQAVVNALWAAGADAVAVNGQRLSARSSIRAAGEAVLVNLQPLHSPYRIDAIGDPVALETSFGQSTAAARMRSYEQLYDIGFAFTRERTLGLAAAVEEPLHVARPAPTTSTRGTTR